MDLKRLILNKKDIKIVDNSYAFCQELEELFSDIPEDSYQVFLQTNHFEIEGNEEVFVSDKFLLTRNMDISSSKLNGIRMLFCEIYVDFTNDEDYLKVKLGY